MTPRRLLSPNCGSPQGRTQARRGAIPPPRMRRSTPEAALGVKKYPFGTIDSSAVEMSDEKDPTASLGHSVVLSVQHPVGELIPELSQRPDEGTKVPSFSRRQDSGDVLPYDPARALLLRDLAVFESERPPRVAEAFPEPADAEALAGRAPDEDVDRFLLEGFFVIDFCHVAQVGRRRIAVREDDGREVRAVLVVVLGVELAVPRGGPPQRLPSHRGRLYPGAHAAESHSMMVGRGPLLGQVTRVTVEDAVLAPLVSASPDRLRHWNKRRQKPKHQLVAS